jgi:16S rRNA C967 or C1407 C5-methylase (RsmB/RsmF family)
VRARAHARALCRYADATAVLCDPSCSGSGQAGAHTLLSGASTSEQQAAALAKLAAQQRAIVLKAMTFPAVETVVCARCRGIRRAAPRSSCGARWML